MVYGPSRTSSPLRPLKPVNALPSSPSSSSVGFSRPTSPPMGAISQEPRADFSRPGGIMRTILALLLIALPVTAAKKPTTAQLQAQVKRLTDECDGLKLRLAATEDVQQELAAARKARDLARTEGETARREADQLKASLKENQGGDDAILKELQAARKAAADAKAEAARLLSQNDSLQSRANAVPGEGDLVTLTEDIQPARPINLNRM